MDYLLFSSEDLETADPHAHVYKQFLYPTDDLLQAGLKACIKTMGSS